MAIRKERPPFRGPCEWRVRLAAAVDEVRAKTIDRRVFLTRINAILALTATVPRSATAGSYANARAADGEAQFADEPWWTLSAVHEHLFPTTPDGPGAKEINATAYLRRTLAEPDMDPDNRKFIPNGAAWLNDIAVEHYETAFRELNRDQREEVLRQIERSGAGERWISLLLLYIFEALLSDPVYGGNPGQVGWRWLGHQPGFPRPDENQTYRKL
jgi:gluconate 2-dehydrogenase gamma chain